MLISKRALLLVISFCTFGAAFGSDQGGWFSNSWLGSFFKSKPVQPKQFTYRGRTPQDVAYEDLVSEYGCDSKDPEAICNIKIPEIELYKTKERAADRFIAKRSSVQKPTGYNVNVSNQKRTLRSYLNSLFVPKFWAGETSMGKDNAIDNIYGMQDKPELGKMLDEGVENNYDPLVKGVQENMEEKVINQALSDVKRNEKKLHQAYDSIDDGLAYALRNVQKCYSRHRKSPEVCEVEEYYAKKADQNSRNLYRSLKPIEKDLFKAEVKLKQRKYELQHQKLAREKLEKQAAEYQKWNELWYRQEVGE